jgi:outer membrane protein TolC
VLLLLAACSNEYWRNEADEQVYSILGGVTESVTGEHKVFAIDRPVDTLRARLQRVDPGTGDVPGKSQPIRLTLVESLDVAAENSREYQRQKELLYLAALGLTGEAYEFDWRYGAGGSADVAGVDDDEADLVLRDALSASRNTESGGRIVASFVNTFLRSLVHGGGWDASGLLSLTFTQPLLRGAGERIAREPLTQAERDVVYQVREFERFRAEFAVRVVTEYFSTVELLDNLTNQEANYQSVVRTREQFEDEERAGRRTQIDLDRARQDELTALDRLVNSRASYAASLDRFKLTLGIPTDTSIELDQRELQRLRASGAVEVDLAEESAIHLALGRRYDHRNVVDAVEDAGRRILVAEDALRSTLDFSAVLELPTEPDEPFQFDWDRVGWAAGFDLQLAVSKLLERNAYRSALINMEAAIRSREESEDRIKLEIRDSLRNIRRTFESYRIQTGAVEVALRRVASSEALTLAGRATALDLLDAKEALLAAQLQATGALIEYAVARIELLRDLEGLVLEPKGLRFDPGLPLPSATLYDPGEPPKDP